MTTQTIQHCRTIAYWRNGSWCRYLDQVENFKLVPEYKDKPCLLVEVPKEWGAAEISQHIQNLVKGEQA